MGLPRPAGSPRHRPYRVAVTLDGRDQPGGIREATHQPGRAGTRRGSHVRRRTGRSLCGTEAGPCRVGQHPTAFRLPRPMFRQVGIVLPGRDGPELFGPDSVGGQVVPMPWPEDWSPLRDFANRMTEGGPPWLDERGGELMESPIMGGRAGGGRGSEAGWLLLQLDLDHLREARLPELVRRHLGINGAVPTTWRSSPPRPEPRSIRAAPQQSRKARSASGSITREA